MGADLQGLRTNAGTGTNNRMPPQKIPVVFHTVIVCSTDHKAEDVQKEQYTLVAKVNDILAENMQLRKPEDATDPKISNSISCIRANQILRQNLMIISRLQLISLWLSL